MAKRKAKKVAGGGRDSSSTVARRSNTKSSKRSASPDELAVAQVKFTVELPEITRRSLKAKAAMEGISMREFLLQALKDAGVHVP